MNVKEILPYFDAITWGLRWQSGKVFQIRCATSSLTIHIRGFLREKPHPDSCQGISWMSLGQESPCPFPPQPAALLAVRSPKRHRTGIYVRTWTSVQAQRDPTSMPPGHQESWPLTQPVTPLQAPVQIPSPCPNAEVLVIFHDCPLSSCPHLWPPQRDKVLRIRQHWPRSHKTPHPDQLCHRGLCGLGQVTEPLWATNPHGNLD